jgi:hypothetical protein
MSITVRSRQQHRRCLQAARLLKPDDFEPVKDGVMMSGVKLWPAAWPLVRWSDGSSIAVTKDGRLFHFRRELNLAREVTCAPFVMQTLLACHHVRLSKGKADAY